jgi:chemotaxis protein methyltransferase CheR
VNSQDFEFVSQLLRKRAGIVLTGDKMYLLESRLAPLARKEGLPSIDDLIHVVRARREERLIGQLVDVMTTNETYFFRDKTPFDHLKDAIFPVLGQARKGSRIRIWCAACSTGQEPYSIAMMLDQSPQLTGGVPVEIVATDISDRCLERARQGLFTQFEVQRGLPIQMLMHYFTQQDDHWRISERMRQMVTFKKLNLMDANYGLGKFDVIFCRNVLIYFDGPTKSAVLHRMGESLNPGGFLMMGAAESLVGVSNSFEPTQDRRGLYKLSSGVAKAASAA